MLSDKYFDTYISLLNIDIAGIFDNLNEKEWTSDNFRFYTAVSVISSSRIEGETLEIDSYLKHKIQDVEYLPNLTERPNDLYAAYEFARDNALTNENFLKAHTIATIHLLPVHLRGRLRTGNMVIMDQQANRVKYEASDAGIVQKEFELFWKELSELIMRPLSVNHVFYYASLIHLVFVKIHPFNDGNGRAGRLLEKWFLSEKLGKKAWYIGSEYYYYQNLEAYYTNLARVGFYYAELDYHKSLPFLLMLPHALLNINADK